MILCNICPICFGCMIFQSIVEVGWFEAGYIKALIVSLLCGVLLQSKGSHMNKKEDIVRYSICNFYWTSQYVCHFVSVVLF